MAATLQVKAISYPESDGKPMGETDRHRSAMVRHIEILSRYFASQQVYVTGVLLLYYEEGDPRKFIVPDAFVAKGLASGERRIYKIWTEGKAPDVVIETTSRKTRKKEVTIKPALYAQLGIPEYFVFDPERDYLHPPLQGYRLGVCPDTRRVGTAHHKRSLMVGSAHPTEGMAFDFPDRHLVDETYERIVPDSTGRLLSAELGWWLSLSERDIEFDVVATGERLLTGGEVALRERAALLEAEAEIARLRAELARRTSAMKRPAE